jgi:exonuclease VII small subunit
MGFRTLIFLVVAVVSCNVATVNASPEGDTIRAKVHQLQADLDNTIVQLAKAQGTVNEQKESLQTAQQQIGKVVEERDGWHSYGDDQHDKWMNAEKRVSDQKVRVLKLGIALGILSLLCIGYGIGHFGYHILP